MEETTTPKDKFESIITEIKEGLDEKFGSNASESVEYLEAFNLELSEKLASFIKENEQLITDRENLKRQLINRS